MPGAPLRINKLGRRRWTPFLNLCAYSVPAFEKVSAVQHSLDAGCGF
jgi:hypothetical protein